MNRQLVVLGVLAIVAGASARRVGEERLVPRTPRSFRESAVVFYDDMEGGAPGWEHHDLDWDHCFHVSQYHAYDDGIPPDHSWWCGTLDPAFAGGDGYGNSWYCRLSVPWVDWTGYVYPVIVFSYRNDTEPGCDFTHVQAESSGTFVNLNRGYDGVIPWSQAGFYLGNRDNPAVCRFRFVSDGAWSDEDWLYDSDGGAFACDEIQIFDYYTGTVLFHDDVEDGIGRCMPEPWPPYDWWHLAELPCRASSDPTCWSVTMFCDTSTVWPAIQNALMSPIIDISGAERCTLFYALHSCVPGPDEGDYWTVEYTVDAGVTWVMAGSWYGDTPPPACNVFGATGLDGISVDEHLPGTWFRMRLVMYTDGDGCGPGASGAAGVFLDDVRVVVSPPPTSVRQMTWGRVKAMYRE